MNLIARGPIRSSTFRISESSGVWCVTKNGVFYGDYLSRSQATEAACFGARTVEAQGGSAKVLTTPGDTPVLHQGPAKSKPERRAADG